MAVTGKAFSTNVETTVDSKMIPKVTDIILNSSPFTLRILGNQKTWVGRTMKFPLKYQKNDQGMSFDGMEKFSTTKKETRIYAEFGPTGRQIPVVLSGIEVDVNATDKQVLDLVALELASSAQDMADDIAVRFNTVQTGKHFLSIHDASDDGTATATYGNLARGTYTTYVGYNNTATGSLTAAKMRTAVNTCTHGNEKPSLIVTTKVLWAAYEALVEAKISANYATSGFPQLTRTGIAAGTQALRGQLGFDLIWFSGIPLVVDERVDSGYMHFINENHLAFYGLKSKRWKPVKFTSKSIEGVYSDYPTTTGFAWSGLMSPIDQYGEVGHLILMGDLITDNPRTLGRLEAATA